MHAFKYKVSFQRLRDHNKVSGHEIERLTLKLIKM